MPNYFLENLQSCARQKKSPFGNAHYQATVLIRHTLRACGILLVRSYALYCPEFVLFIAVSVEMTAGGNGL